jgi:hypothetical protein
MSRSWFLLDRHDDPPADPPDGPPAADPPATGEPDPEGASQLGDPGKKALDAMKADRNAARKALADAQKKLTEFEDRDKTDAEKLTAAKEAAEKRAQAATARAVAAEVKALAAGEFADPSDAVLLGDLSKYATSDGDVDTETIKADLAALLTSKPHLKKAAGPRSPAPDGSQGRGGTSGPVDYSKASKDEFAAELGKYGLRPRSYS